jgi:hypothetical protein
MLRRVRWLGTGAIIGLASSVWAQRKARALAARYRPAGIAGTAVERARTWPGELRAALDEGRTTMRAREAELRQELGPTAASRR